MTESVRKPTRDQPITALSESGQLWPMANAKAARTPVAGEMFRELDAELWLAHKLFREGVSGLAAFAGITDRTLRRERTRRAMLEHGLGDAHCGVRAGQRRSFAEIFEIIYGEPLEPPIK